MEDKKEEKKKEKELRKEQKEMMKQLNDVSTSISQAIKEDKQSELLETRFYSEFEIQTEKGPIVLYNVYITSERNKEGDMEYHFYWVEKNEETGEMTVEEKMMIDKDGKALAIGNLKDYLRDERINMSEMIPENDKQEGRLKGAAIEENAKNLQNGKQGNNQENSKEDNKEEDEKQVNQDLEAQGKRLGISNFRKITDTRLHQKNPEVFGEDSEHAIGYSSTLGSYVVLEKPKQGEENAKPTWKLNENVGTCDMNFRSIITFDEKGDKVEKKIPQALLRTNRSDREIAITVESKDYGRPDVETVKRMPCGLRVGRSVRTEGEGLEAQGYKSVANKLESTNPNKITESTEEGLAKEVNEKVPNAGLSGEPVEVDIEQISPSDEIKGKDGEGTGWTLEKLAEETGENMEVLKVRLASELQKSGGDIKAAIEIIVDDYRNVNREHKR